MHPSRLSGLQIARLSSKTHLRQQQQSRVSWSQHRVSGGSLQRWFSGDTAAPLPNLRKPRSIRRAPRQQRQSRDASRNRPQAVRERRRSREQIPEAIVLYRAPGYAEAEHGFVFGSLQSDSEAWKKGVHKALATQSDAERTEDLQVLLKLIPRGAPEDTLEAFANTSQSLQSLLEQIQTWFPGLREPVFLCDELPQEQVKEKEGGSGGRREVEKLGTAVVIPGEENLSYLYQVKNPCLGSRADPELRIRFNPGHGGKLHKNHPTSSQATWLVPVLMTVSILLAAVSFYLPDLRTEAEKEKEAKYAEVYQGVTGEQPSERTSAWEFLKSIVRRETSSPPGSLGEQE